MTGQIIGGGGSASAPSIIPDNDSLDTGLYGDSNDIKFATEGVLRASISNTALTSIIPLHTTSGRTLNTTAVAVATYSILVSDHVLFVNYGGAVTVTLLDAQAVDGRIITIKDTSGDASSNNITITSQTNDVDGGSVVINTNYGKVTVVSDGNDWFTI